MEPFIPTAPPRRRKQIWTPSQRKAILALTLPLLIFLLMGIMRRPFLVGDPPPESSARGQDIANRLDPNTATAEELSAIPNLGEKKAHEIVEFRDSFYSHHVDKTAFVRGEDLMQIKGFGVGTVKNLEPYFAYHP